ncbi:glycosyltransferase family 39 protein, partial [Escherichia coli]|nr:glycosyltransferase family 39 protein [Escherichia coli]
PSLLLMPPLDRDESRFAQATAQMLESHDYVDIRFQDEPRWKKPVGIYWLQAAAVSLTSDVEDREIAPYRIPSLLGAML